MAAAFLLLALLSLFCMPLSISKPTYVSYPLTHRDAAASLIRSQEADPSDLPDGMPMREFVATGRAMAARAGRGRGRGRGPASVVGSSLSYLNEIVGEFYLTMYVGHPPQMLIFFVDTGSELTWAPCTPCKACSKSFVSNKSSSYRQVPCTSRLCSQSLGIAAGCDNSTKLCTFQLTYGDGSIKSGFISVDSFHLNKIMSKSLVFGCAMSVPEAVQGQLTGLVGLNAGPFSFTSQLLGGNSKLSNKFAYCLPDRINNLNSQGTILFGNYMLPSKLKYTPLLPPYEPLGDLYYFVKLEGISVGSRFIKGAMEQEGLNVGGTIFDSGTAVTRLVEPLYAELVVEMKRQTMHLHPFSIKGSSTDVCYKLPLDADGLPRVPLITMHFAKGVELELGPGSVLYSHGVDHKNIIVCLAFGKTPDQLPLNIIGNYQQQNYWVEYNLQTFSLGLAKAKCGTRRL